MENETGGARICPRRDKGQDCSHTLRREGTEFRGVRIWQEVQKWELRGYKDARTKINGRKSEYIYHWTKSKMDKGRATVK
jgi:trimethylamine:corrinoid methyltransferase-like protein